MVVGRMKISELIAELEAVKAVHGDCRVLVHNGRYGYQDDLQIDNGYFYDMGEYAGWRCAADAEAHYELEAGDRPEHCVRVLGFND